MIVLGFQGIGKSTLVKNHKSGYIDLESGNFWVDGKRADDWYKPYCQIAEHLSQQGYTILTSSHQAVLDRLQECSKERIVLVYPSLSLKDTWISKLEERWNTSSLDKDFKAFINAKERYTENILELSSRSDSMFTHIELNNMDYNLYQILNNLI